MTARPLPEPTGLTAEWYAYCHREELRFQRCRACGRWRHPPRFLCPTCGSEEWSWERSSGRGALFTWTVTHQALHPAFVDLVPYAVAVVELEEGVRVVSGLRGLPLTDLRLDLALDVAFEVLSETITVPVFTPTR
jgi:uncharacterized OB-fold protein